MNMTMSSRKIPNSSAAVCVATVGSSACRTGGVSARPRRGFEAGGDLAEGRELGSRQLRAADEQRSNAGEAQQRGELTGELVVDPLGRVGTRCRAGAGVPLDGEQPLGPLDLSSPQATHHRARAPIRASCIVPGPKTQQGRKGTRHPRTMGAGASGQPAAIRRFRARGRLPSARATEPPRRASAERPGRLPPCTRAPFPRRRRRSSRQREFDCRAAESR